MTIEQTLADVHHMLQAAQCLFREIEDTDLMQHAMQYLENVKSIPGYADQMDSYFRSAGREATLFALIGKASELSRL